MAEIEHEDAPRRPRKGDRVTYRHPNYPKLIRKGVVEWVGEDGCTVRHRATHRVERVRLRDLNPTVRVRPKGDITKDAPLAKSARLGSPFRRALVSQRLGGVAPARRPQPTGGSPLAAATAPPMEEGRQWQPRVVRRPYEVGDGVVFQRPDMPEAAYGKIECQAATGCVVSVADGSRYKVRWPDVRDRAQVGVGVGERQAAYDALRGMGIEMDPLEGLLRPERSGLASPGKLARLQALAEEGAPIDLGRAKDAPDQDLDGLIAFLSRPAGRSGREGGR